MIQSGLVVEVLALGQVRGQDETGKAMRPLGN